MTKSVSNESYKMCRGAQPTISGLLFWLSLVILFQAYHHVYIGLRWTMKVCPYTQLQLQDNFLHFFMIVLERYCPVDIDPNEPQKNALTPNPRQQGNFLTLLYDISHHRYFTLDNRQKGGHNENRGGTVRNFGIRFHPKFYNSGPTKWKLPLKLRFRKQKKASFIFLRNHHWLTAIFDAKIRWSLQQNTFETVDLGFFCVFLVIALSKHHMIR